MLDIANTSKCNGCHACFSVCPVRAISMKSDSEGFLRPVIDYDICTGCGKCESVCPVLHPPILPDADPVAFACKNTNEDIRLKSSSGGVFTVLAESIIDRGGVVFGARFDSDFSVFHGWADTKEGLESFRGSKYVQSTIGNAFIECKKFLEDGRTVLFSGTPCQIGGLKAFLGKEYDNLYTVDIICHGVPSPLLWEKYCDFRKSTAKEDIREVSFRFKSTGWKNYSVKMDFWDSTSYESSFRNDPYMKMFLKDVALRNSCYNCVFKGARRVSDITLADFWGVQNCMPDEDDDKGTSLVLVHSKKGKDLFEKESELEKIHVDVLEVLQYNKAALVSVNQPKERNLFFIDLVNMDFSVVIKKYGKDCFHKKLFKFAKRFVKKQLVDTGVIKKS